MKSKGEPIEVIKFSKYQAIVSVLLIFALYESIVNLIKQGMLNHDYRWFIVFGIVIAYLFWNVIRITIYMIIGVPAVIITKRDITLTQKGYVIEWDDITNMDYVVTGSKSRSYTLVIDVKDPWKYISTIKNPLMRNYCWYAKDYYYKPFTIDLGNVEGDNSEIFDTVERYYRTYH
jgi:hypothetical protein